MQSNTVPKVLTLVSLFALVAVGCGAPPASGEIPTAVTGADVATPLPAPTPAPTLVGTWIASCGDTMTTIEITADAITIATHVDGQADQAMTGAYRADAGRLILDQDGAELDLGAFLVDGDSLAIVGAFSGVYKRATP